MFNWLTDLFDSIKALFRRKAAAPDAKPDDFVPKPPRVRRLDIKKKRAPCFTCSAAEVTRNYRGWRVWCNAKQRWWSDRKLCRVSMGCKRGYKEQMKREARQYA